MLLPMLVLLAWRVRRREDAGMAEIVNLRRVKKQRAQAEADAHAAENRVRHGRTAAQKRADRLAEQRRQAALDGKRHSEDPEPA
jgi:hypothetical protein